LEQDLRAVLHLAAGRTAEPSAAIIDSRTPRSTPESGQRAGYDGAKHKHGSKLHMAVDTLGHLLALHVTPANVDDRAEIDRLTDAISGVYVRFGDIGPPSPAEGPAWAQSRRHPAALKVGSRNRIMSRPMTSLGRIRPSAPQKAGFGSLYQSRSITLAPHNARYGKLG
jgi:hypothetical protein